jgi:Zn-dependent protease
MMHVDLQGVAIFLLVFLFSMSIHEMMHAFVADYLGDDTARLQGRRTLNPLPHIDPIFTLALPLILYISHSSVLFGAAKPVQVNFNRLRYGEFGAALVGLAGPLTNLVIACLAAILFRDINPQLGSNLYSAFQIGIALNIGLFLFNSIPWPPLDGSRVLYAFAPRPLQELMESIERLGMFSIVILIFLVYPLVQGPLANLYASLIHALAPGLVL